MKTLQIVLLTLTLALSGFLAQESLAGPPIKINADRYAAIAFSPSTGHYGYSWNCGSLSQARRLALANCSGEDARVLTWVQFGWAALVIAEDGAYGYAEVHGDGVSDREAIDEARAHLRKHSDRPIKTIVVVCSGDVDPKVMKLR